LLLGLLEVLKGLLRLLEVLLRLKTVLLGLKLLEVLLRLLRLLLKLLRLLRLLRLLGRLGELLLSDGALYCWTGWTAAKETVELSGDVGEEATTLLRRGQSQERGGYQQELHRE